MAIHSHMPQGFPAAGAAKEGERREHESGWDIRSRLAEASREGPQRIGVEKGAIGGGASIDFSCVTFKNLRGS